MTISKIRSRLAAVLCATAVGGALLGLSGGPAHAASFPISYIVGSGSNAHFDPDGLEATSSVPAECAGYHAAFAVINETYAVESIQYYGGTAVIPVGGVHFFCIGGDANGYIIEYHLYGTRSLLDIWVP
jgi:hypothetical protein